MGYTRNIPLSAMASEMKHSLQTHALSRLRSWQRRVKAQHRTHEKAFLGGKRHMVRRIPRSSVHWPQHQHQTSILLRQLIAKLKSTTSNFTEETIFISIENMWKGQLQLLLLIQFRNEVKGVPKHLSACLYKEHQEEVLKIFLEEHQTLYKSIH